MPDNMHDKYLEIISKCKFIANEDEWFIAGAEAKLTTDWIHPHYEKGDKFNSPSGLFRGYTSEPHVGYDGVLPREDEEICAFDEFTIYDEFGMDISNMTLIEYYNLKNYEKN